MVVDIKAEDLELSLLALFAGWAMADRVQRRLAADGFGELRINDGVVIQHVVAGPLSITALAERMGITQQAASKAVADLEARGLVERRRSTEDARTRHLHLTGRGRDAVRAARTVRAELDAELAAEFGAGRIAETRELLAGILTRFDAGDAIRRRRVRPPI
ncbi:MarR family transcriptional regulator [Actinomadura sp. NAK00032]|uniref:MarR family winged helix-turn-helix transcriptional regulator n=1 Tax=Actinomadura sp. NAK00032 TaxID=2742128 RepID=UPI0015925C37|nr:MarR family transcriptional regulator [Actinomadura sp. NAK00032]QKW39996.1 MarR family transcriptional regulator [Actinomadura sp. NAK00032]